MDLIIDLAILLVLLVCVWGAVWAINTYIVGKAPFIAEPFKAIIIWVVTVIAVLISLVLVFDWVSSLGGSNSLSLHDFHSHLPYRR